MKMNLDFSAYECRGITSQSPEAETLRRMNPTDNELTVKYNLLKQECAIIEIFDILGREVVGIKTKSNTTQANIDVSSLQTGIYTIQFQTDTNEKQIGKFLKQ